MIQKFIGVDIIDEKFIGVDYKINQHILNDPALFEVHAARTRIVRSLAIEICKVEHLS